MIPRRAAHTALMSGAFLLFLALTTSAFQAPESLSEALDQRWRWTRFSRADGLPAGGVQHVLDDGEEVLFGTESGLFRFDGWRFHQVSLEGAKSPKRAITAVIKGPGGRRWASTRRELFVEEPATGTFTRSWVSEGHGPIATVHATQTGVLVQTSLDGAVVLTRVEDGEEDQDLSTPTNSIGRVWKTAYGDLWFAAHKRLFRLEGETWKEIPVPGLLVVHQLEQTASGKGILACTAGPPGNRILEWTDRELPKNSEDSFYGVVRGLAVAPTGEAVVVYDADEVRIHETEGWVSPLDPPDALLHAKQIWFRPNGDLWVVAQSELWLVRRRAHRWTNYRFPGVGNPQNRLSDFEFDTKGNCWIATGRGVSVRDPSGELVDVPEPETGGNGLVTGIALDPRGRPWIASGSGFAGVMSWDGGTWRSLTKDTNGEPIGLVHKIRRDTSGDLWLLGLSDSLENAQDRRGGVFRLREDQAERWTPADVLGERRFYDLVQTQDGALWLASDQGVHRYADSAWRSWTTQDGLRSSFVACLAPRNERGVWAGHDWSTGLLSIDPKSGLRYHAFGDKYRVTGLAPGDDGSLWFASPQGIHRIAGDRISNLGSSAGLKPARIWPIRVVGDRVFAGSLGGGLSILEPEERSYPPPRVTIGSTSLDSGVLLADWRPNAWWGLRPPEEIPTRYRVDDEPWSPWSLDHNLERSGLSSGSHTLEVQAIGLFGDVARTPAVRTVHAAPPTWRHPLFLAAIGGMAIAFSVLAVVSLRRRQRDESELRRSEAEYRSLMEQASDGFFLCDEDAVCRVVNPRGQDLMQRDAHELLGARFESLFTSPKDVRLFLEQIASGGNHLCEVTVAQSSEDAEDLQTQVELGGKQLADGRLQIIARDVTNRRRLESERRQLEHRLMESQRHESLAQLAGGVAHEFNNLLLVVSGNTEAALLKEHSDKDHLQKALGAVREASELTHQLLAYGGISAFEDRCLDLRTIVSDVDALLRASTPRNVTLHFEEADQPLPVDGDPGSLRQVVVNLVMDAAAAIGKEPGKVTIQTHGDELTVRCVISDNGPGLDEASCERAFDPFVSEEGSGLGLAAARGIVEAHNGHIGLRSWEGYGRTFSVQLPRSNRQPEAPVQTDASAWEPTGCVLIIDDEPGILEVLSVMIGRIGFETLVANGGHEGLRLFEANQEHITCALVDLSMPDLSGLDVIESIRSKSPSTSLILMSGFSEDMFDRDRARQASIMRKPFSYEELRERLRSSAGVNLDTTNSSS